MRRRTVLALGAGALAGTSGCLGTLDRGDSGMGASVPEGYDIGMEAVQRGIVRYTYPDAIAVVGTDNRFVVVNVAVQDLPEPPQLTDFSLRFDGEGHSPTEEPDSQTLYRLSGSFYSVEDPGGNLLFELPANGEASDAALTWPDGEWPLPETVRQRIAAAPEFSVSLDEEPTDSSYTLTPRNEGDRPQRFLLAMNQAGAMYKPLGVRTALLDGGATERFEIPAPSLPDSIRTENGDHGTTGPRLVLDWVGGDAERTVPVE